MDGEDRIGVSRIRITTNELQSRSQRTKTENAGYQVVANNTNMIDKKKEQMNQEKRPRLMCLPS